MASLTPNSPLQAVADILHAAVVLGAEAWDGDTDGRRRITSTGSTTEIYDDLRALFTLLSDRKVAYLLVGGIALLKYVEGRNTQDIDLILSADSLKRMPEVVILDRRDDFICAQFRSLRVDVLLTTNRLFKEVKQRHGTRHRFQELEVHCATVEGLVLLKLYALPPLYRQGDGQRAALYEADLTMLIERHRPDLEGLFKVLEPHVDDGALASLREIVGDIERRIERMRRAARP